MTPVVSIDLGILTPISVGEFVAACAIASAAVFSIIALVSNRASLERLAKSGSSPSPEDSSAIRLNPSKVSEVSTKLIGVSLVAGLALYSDYWPTYLAAIFIIATIITEQSFLEKLAAIIMRNDAFFRYETSKLSLNEIKEKVAQEIVEDNEENIGDKKPEESSEGTTSPTQQRPDESLTDALSRIYITHTDAYIIEELALSFAERMMGPIERNIRVSKVNTGSLILDGLIRGRQESDAVIDVRMISGSSSRQKWRSIIMRFSRQLSAYTEITGRKAMGTLLVVFPDKLVNRDLLVEEFNRSQFQPMSLLLTDLQEIGYESSVKAEGKPNE